MSNHSCAVVGCNAEDAFDTEVIINGKRVIIRLCCGEPLPDGSDMDGGHIREFKGEDWNSINGAHIRWVKES